MDNRDLYTILNFIWLLLKLWLLIPLAILIIVNSIFIYIPSSFITVSNKFLYLLIYFVMLSISLSVAYGLWDKYTAKVKYFTDETYRQTVKLVENAQFKFRNYLNFISKVNKITSYIISKQNLSGFIGIFIDWVILFFIYNPFRRMMI